MLQGESMVVVSWCLVNGMNGLVGLLAGCTCSSCAHSAHCACISGDQATIVAAVYRVLVSDWGSLDRGPSGA